MLNKTPIIKLFLLAICFSFSGPCLFGEEKDEKKKKTFPVTEGMIQATERLLSKETNLQRRLQLLLRLLKFKEERVKTKKYKDEGEGTKEFKKVKKELLETLRIEIEKFKKVKGLDLDILYREYGARLLEFQQYMKSYQAFRKIKNRTPDDEMGYGDSLLASGLTALALQAYARGSKAERYYYVGAYKKAWAHLRLRDFKKALKEFDVAVQDGPYSLTEIRQDAFRDRLRPFVETYPKKTFDQEEVEKLRVITQSIHKNSPEKQKKLFLRSLKLLIRLFSGRAKINLAEDVYSFVEKEEADPIVVLIRAAPSWLKTYRGRLKHKSVLKTLERIPNNRLDQSTSNELYSEMNNTAAFYETLLRDEPKGRKGKGANYLKKILTKIYGKYFILYPFDLDADGLRVNYARLLLSNSQTEECFRILKLRSGKNKAIEKVSVSMIGKCELRHLEKLYEGKHDLTFYDRLHKNLLEEKIYQRSDLGVPSEKIFEDFTRMVIGAIAKDQTEPNLRKILSTLITEYPYSKKSPLYSELKVVSAELKFKDVTEGKEDLAQSQDDYYKIFINAPQTSAVAQKALQNSILLGKDLETIKRCNQFAQLYRNRLPPESDVFKRCTQLAEENLDLKSEYSFIRINATKLNKTQVLRMGFLELALGKKEGPVRLKKLNTIEAKKLLKNWYPPRKERKKNHKSKTFNRLNARANKFMKGLRKISFKRIGKTVPRQVKKFGKIDTDLAKYYQISKKPLFQSLALVLRVRVNAKIRDWIKNLPEPKGLPPEKLEEYRTQTKAVVQPWEEKAKKRKEECSTIAHALTPDFKEVDKTICPEATLDATYEKYIEVWKKTWKKKPSYTFESSEKRKKAEIVEKLLDAGLNAKGPNMGKYFLLRALNLTNNDYVKAQIIVGLAQITKSPRYWKLAAVLNGNRVEPIEWFLTRVKGNPFFERLYEDQIALTKARF